MAQSRISVLTVKRSITGEGLELLKYKIKINKIKYLKTKIFKARQNDVPEVSRAFCFNGRWGQQ